MTREEAEKLLGVPPGSRVDAVRAAYADAVKAAHPDHGGTGNLGPLKTARDVLLETATTDCPRCHGSGWVAVGFRKERCPRGC